MNIRATARMTAAFALTMAATVAKAQQGESVKVPRSVLERYVGEYVYPSGNTAVVRLEGDALIREVGQQHDVFRPISETRFKLGPVFTAEFIVDSAGGVTKVLSDGVGTEIRVARKGSRVAAPTPPLASAVHVPRSVLERYVGEYVYTRAGPPIVMTVRLRGDTLVRQISGEPAVVLTPLSETRFMAGSASLVTEFVIDKDGSATQIMGSGDQQRISRRKPRS